MSSYRKKETISESTWIVKINNNNTAGCHISYSHDSVLFKKKVFLVPF